MTTTRVLGAGDVAGVVARIGVDAFLDELIAGLFDALSSHDAEALVTFDRSGFHYEKPALGLIEWMPAMEVGRAVAVKTVGYHPTNPIQRSMPSVLATTALYDTVSGELLAMAEASLLTALRTGAASAVATDLLTPQGPVTLGVVGAGAQAVTQIHAISRVRAIESVVACDADPATTASLVERLAGTGIAVEAASVGQLDEIRSASDVLCTCTSVEPGSGPVLSDGDHKPWLHINAVGADFAGKVELPLDLLARATVCPDVRSQCIVEGECQQLPDGAIGPDLADLVQNRSAHASLADQPTVFDSTGWSLEDLVAIELLLDHAHRLGIGELIDFRPPSGDPYDPYVMLRTHGDAGV